MQPEVRFTLNAGAVEQLDQILAANSLSFTRLSRETFEVLDKGHPYAIGSESYEKTHGVLKHGTREFPCSLEKYPNRWILCATGEDLQDNW